MKKKIFCLVTNDKDHYRIKMTCCVQTLSKKKVIETLNYKISISDMDNEFAKELIFNDLKRLHFKKAQIIIGLNLSDIFIEKIRIPNLNSIDAKKTLALEIKKLYGSDFNNTYIYAKTKYRLNKHILDYYYTICKKNIYQQIIGLFSKLQLKIVKVQYITYALKQYLCMKKVFIKNSFSMFIHIDKQQTIILIGKNDVLLNNSIVQLGTDYLNELLVSSVPNNQLFSNIEENKLEEMVQIFLQKVNIELKKILYLSQVEIDKYYLNVEADEFAPLIKKVIEQELNITISDLKLVDKQDFLLQSLKIHHTFIVSNHDFKFQVKVK